MKGIQAAFLIMSVPSAAGLAYGLKRGRELGSVGDTLVVKQRLGLLSTRCGH